MNVTPPVFTQPPATSSAPEITIEHLIWKLNRGKLKGLAAGEGLESLELIELKKILKAAGKNLNDFGSNYQVKQFLKTLQGATAVPHRTETSSRGYQRTPERNYVQLHSAAFQPGV